MATGRHDVDFEGVDPVVLPFKIDGSTITYDKTKEGGSSAVGFAATLSAARTAALAGDGERVLGKILKVEADGFASIQVGGGCSLPGGTGATLTSGVKIVGDLGGAGGAVKGYIRNAASGVAAELLAADHEIYDPTTATAVQVRLK